MGAHCDFLDNLVEAFLRGTDRLANMFSYGICIMSMVHCQWAVLLQFPVVIYLAELLKCSCHWHWLTNQTVKLHPEYQRKHGFKIFVYHLLLDYVLHKSTWWHWLLFLCGHILKNLVKGVKWRGKRQRDNRIYLCWHTKSASSQKLLFHHILRKVVQLWISSSWII